MVTKARIGINSKTGEAGNGMFPAAVSRNYVEFKKLQTIPSIV